MDTTTLIFEQPSGTQMIQIAPSEPKTYTLLFEGQGRVLYGTNGEPPVTPLQSGVPTPVHIHMEFIQIKYTIAGGRLQWES